MWCVQGSGGKVPSRILHEVTDVRAFRGQEVLSNRPPQGNGLKHNQAYHKLLTFGLQSSPDTKNTKNTEGEKRMSQDLFTTSRKIWQECSRKAKSSAILTLKSN